MKKSFYLMAAALLTFAGCSNEELVQQVPNQFNTLTATIEQSPSDSRIAVNDNNTLAWSDGDAIRVFMKNPATNDPSYYDYVFTNGTFSPRDNGDPVPAGTTNDNVLGVYSLGADDNGDYSDGSIDENNDKKLNSGFSQNTVIKDGAQNRIILPMWGKWNDGAIAFKHLAGVLRINLSDLPDGYDLLTITSDEAISGNAYVNDVTVENAVMVMENYQGTGDHNIITVRFMNAENRTLYVPLPVNESYGSIEVKVSKYDENLSEGQYKDPIILATYTNKEVKRGYIYTASPATPQVTGTLPTDVSSAINSGSNQETFILASEVDATAPNAGSIAIPDNKEKTILDFQVTPKTSQDAPLKFESNTSSSSTDATQELDINMPSDADELYAEINTPTTTTTLNGGSYKIVTATTATNTLIVKTGTLIEKLILKGGNVRIEEGTVTSIYDAEGNEYILVTTLDALKTAIAGDKNIILGADITSTEILTIDRALTLNGNGYTLKNTSTSSSIRAINIEVNGKVIIKNLTVEAACQRAFNVINQPAKLTLESVTATAKNYAVMVATSAGAATLDIKNSDMTGANTIQIAGAGTNAKITNTDITSIDNNANEGYAAIALNNTADNAIVTVDGGTITLTGSYVDGSFAGYSTANGTSITFTNVQGDNLEIKHGACYISYSNLTSYGFNSLADALTKVKNGETITLAEDVVISANTVVNAGVTIDGANYSISTDEPEGISGKGKGVFKLAGGTIKNVNFTSPNTQYDIIVTAGGSVITDCKFATASTVTNAARTTTYGKRAIYTGSSVELTGTLTVENCTFDDKVYAFNFLSGKNKMDATFEKCTLGGWLSGTGKTHTFTDCTFTKSGDYANYIPYCPATFNGCSFVDGFTISLKHGSTYTFDKNCKYNEAAVTEPENLKWDFSGDGTDNGTKETLTIGTTTWGNTDTETATWN